MARRFAGSKPDEVLKFEGEAIRAMRVDPDPSRFGEIPIDEQFAARLAKEGQQQPGLVRIDSEDNPVLFVGRRRRVHVLYINDHPERWEEWGCKGPLTFMVRYRPVTREQAAEMAVSENLEREDLRAIDKAQLAQAYALLDKEPAWIAARLRVTTTRVKQLLDLFALGTDVLELVAENRLTETAARGLKGLSPEAIAVIVERMIQSGERPHAVLAEIREQHRQKGKPKPRTTREVTEALKAHPSAKADLFLAWMGGDHTVKLDEVFG